MKTSTLLLSLLIINSSFLAGYITISTELIASLNPFYLGLSEFFLGVLYYINTILKGARDAFDVDFTF